MGDLLDFGKLFKAFGSNLFTQISTFLGNFCKGVKIYHFSSKIIFGQLLQTFGDFFWSHCFGPSQRTRWLSRFMGKLFTKLNTLTMQIQFFGLKGASNRKNIYVVKSSKPEVKSCRLQRPYHIYHPSHPRYTDFSNSRFSVYGLGSSLQLDCHKLEKHPYDFH